jgi:hypothetical protein
MDKSQWVNDWSTFGYFAKKETPEHYNRGFYYGLKSGDFVPKNCLAGVRES